MVGKRMMKASTDTVFRWKQLLAEWNTNTIEGEYYHMKY
jgi:hypothetical protein